MSSKNHKTHPKSQIKTAFAECPYCGEDVRVNQPWVGKSVVCRSCDSEWEVVKMNPLELDWPVSGEEDDFDPYADYND